MQTKIHANLQNLVDKFVRDAEYHKIEMRVKDFMRVNPRCLKTGSNLKDAIMIMVSDNIDSVPIVNEDNSLVGVVTKTLALREIIRGRDIDQKIETVMKENPLVTDALENCLKLIKVPIGSIPVVENRKVKGMITVPDTTRATFSAVLMLHEELKTIYNSAHSGLIATDMNGNVQMINHTAERIMRLPHESVLGKSLPCEVLNEKLLKVIKSGGKILGDKFSVNDKIVVANVNAMVYEDEVIGAVAVLQDISDLESISEELRYTKNLKSELDALFESSFDGIYVTDVYGTILGVNSAFTRITGVQREELIGKTVNELVDAGVFRNRLQIDNIMEGKPVTVSQEIRTGKTILVTSSPVIMNNTISRIVHNVRDITELNYLKNELEKAENLSLHYRSELEKTKLPSKYVAKSVKSKALVELVMRLSKIDATILLMGESGVGKDVIAEMLHENSIRKDKPMMAINCAAIPENLLESELFGYEPGAFTGAHKKGKLGAFELASGGTLFLDEIGEMPMSLQSKLLRVLQKKEITKLGGGRATKIDVRIIAATNRDLEAMISANTFRRDLFYRLNVIPIVVPPLRERKEEIPDFVYHFAKMFNEKYGFNKHFDERVIYEFLDYDWPGNIRELENVIERSMITSQSNIINNAEFFGASLRLKKSEPQTAPVFNYKHSMEHLDREMISNALSRFGSTRKAASALGMSQPTLVRKMAKYKIKPVRNRDSESDLSVNRT